MEDYKIILLLTDRQYEIITEYINKSDLTKRTIVEIAIISFMEYPYINVLAQVDKRVKETDARKTKSLNIVMSENHHKMILQYIERNKDDSKSRVKKISIGKVVLSALLNHISVNSELHEIDRIEDEEEKFRVRMMKIGQLTKEYSEYKYELSKNKKEITFTEHEYIKCQMGLNDTEIKELINLYQNTGKLIKNKFMQGKISLDTFKVISGLSKDNQSKIVKEIESRNYKISNKTIRRIMKELDINANDIIPTNIQKKCYICNKVEQESKMLAIKEKNICKNCACFISKMYTEKYT